MSNDNMLIYPGDELKVVVRRTIDGENDGSLIRVPYPGHAYCIAKAPRYASDAEWEYNANLIATAIRNMKE